jgi:preprotein translocase subunit SecA
MLGLFGKKKGGVVISARKIKKMDSLVQKINGLEKDFEALDNTVLQAKTDEFRKRIEKNETLDDLLPEAFATVRETAKRLLEQRHYDVQLMGGITLHEGKIAEMRTGEGKTLVSTLAAYLNALPQKGVHIVTVNDYLARRDAVWMGQIYDFLGISVGVVTGDGAFRYTKNPTPEKKDDNEELDEERDELGSFKVVDEFLEPCTATDAYNCDITYGTNSQFGFDYLRDNTVYNKDDLRQREFNYCIIDEVDSVLIDEARVPLILSTSAEESENLYETFAGVARKMDEGDDFTIDHKKKTISITDAGISKAEKELGVENIYTDKGIRYVHHLENALHAKALKRKDKEYVVRDGKIVIVDEFTGRLLPTRQWSKGIHQAVEAKEGLELQKETRTFASITYQNFFRMYKKLSGMTGTAETSAEEFFTVYSLDVVTIPTNREIKRIDHNDLLYKDERAKFRAIAKRVKELTNKGQPVLIGTVSVEKNELLSEYLKAEGVKHDVLNAKQHEREGEVVAQAGRRGSVTIATNMAGRGVDIKLGGNPASDKLEQEVKELGGLFVLGTERHDARRIDNQLRGRAGRQGDPGTTQFFISLDDELVRRFAPESIRNILSRTQTDDSEPLSMRPLTRAVEKAQEKIEGFNFDARKNVLQYDSILDTQRSKIYGDRKDILGAEKEKTITYMKDLLPYAKDNKHEDEVAKKIEELSQTDDGWKAMKYVVLRTFDMFWMDHLDTMEHIRSSVGLRGFGQRDPLVEYKREGVRLFNELQSNIKAHITDILPRVQEQTVKPVNAQNDRAQLALTRLGNVGRNDVLIVKKDNVTEEVKFKKIDQYLADGWQIVGKKES